MTSPDERSGFIVDTLVGAFSELMEADPTAFRRRFRTMAGDPFSFYRGSAPLFYADMADRDDRQSVIDAALAKLLTFARPGDLPARLGANITADEVRLFDLEDPEWILVELSWGLGAAGAVEVEHLNLWDD